VQLEATVRPTRIPYVPGLDGLRGLLVFPVLLFHYSITAGWTPQRVYAPGSFFAPSTFFTLSGFLITSLLLAEHERTGRIDGRGFWSRRFRRLLPASVLVVVAVAVAPLVWPTTLYDLPGSDLLGPLFSVANWQAIIWADQGEAGRLLGPLGIFWSLSLEEQFYLGLFLVVVVVSALRRHLATWLTAALVLIGVSSLVSTLLVDSTPQREFFGTDSRAAELVAGCLLAVWIHHRGVPRWWGWTWVGLAAIVTSVVAWATVSETSSWVLRGGLPLFSLVSIGLILGAITNGPTARALAFGPAVWLGRISYPVYLIHWPLVFFIRPAGTWFVGWPVIIVRSVVAVVLAWAVFHWVERPLRTASWAAAPRGTVVWAGAAAVALAAATWVAGWS
jgi:peptidoglycan/LPS O-acetylase OafA/YrhL